MLIFPFLICLSYSMFTFLICLSYSMFTFLFIHQDHTSNGSLLVQFKSYMGTLLIYDRYRTSLYPNLCNNAGIVSTLLRIPLALPTVLFRTWWLHSHLFPSQQQLVTFRVVHQVIHPAHRSSEQLSTPLHVPHPFMDLVKTLPYHLWCWRWCWSSRNKTWTYGQRGIFWQGLWVVDCLSEVEVECPDRACAGVIARLEGRRQELGWTEWDQMNVRISDPW